jgi:hypothetical protein
VFMSCQQNVLAARIENNLCSCIVNKVLSPRIENGLCLFPVNSMC